MANEYTFIPWLRRGLPSSIQQADVVGASARAELDVQVRLNDAAPAQPPASGDASVKLQMYGPGDVVGLSRKQITRIEPRPGSANVIPNYFPLIEFARADLPWLFTPARANNKQQLRPWLVLIVVQKTQGVEIQRAQGKLDVIAGFSPDDLPPLEESWAWAHAHAAEEVNGTGLRKLIEDHPERVGSRLMCPRKLLANTNYIACLVPAFDAGVKAGLGQDPVSTLDYAWTTTRAPAGGRLPMYFHWEFSTGDAEDFESLARKLQPRQSTGLGSRLMDVSAPGFGMPTTSPTGAGATLAMEGALTPPRFVSTVWDTTVRTRFEDALVLKVNTQSTYLEQGIAAGDPIVAPPIYGRWHAAQTKVARTGGRRWLRELNLDPRNRVAAAYGTKIVQEQQERLMDEAWEQVGELREAGRLLRRAQLARGTLGSVFTRHFSSLSPGALLQLARPVLGRVKTSGVTARAEIAKTALPIGLLSPVVIRALRPRGPLIRHVFNPAAVPVPGSGATGLIDRVVVGTANGTIEGAPPAPPVPGGAVTPKTGAAAVWPAWLPKEILDLIEETLERLVQLYPFLKFKLDILRALQRLCRGDYTKEEIENLPPQPGFVPVPPGGAPDESPYFPIPGAQDSAAGAEFRDAFGDLAGVIDQQRAASDEDRDRTKFPPLNLADLRIRLLDGLNPEKTVPKRVAGRLQFNPGRWNFADLLEPILAYPEFDEPMYSVLAKSDPDLLLPGVREIAKDSVLLLETNRQFIESYMIGLNHEFARELLWREFPTDQRGSYFRQFWDVSQQLPPAPAQADRDRLRDIAEAHLWSSAAALGGNTPTGTEPERLVFLLKTELFRRFPTAVVYAAKAKPGLVQRQPKLLADAAPGEEIEKFPVFSGEIGEDVRFFGFELTAQEVRGSANNPGWFFVIQQQPSEPRFGLDLPPISGDLNWGEVSTSHVRLTGQVGRFASLDTSAKCAKATLQLPIRILFHADKLLPES